MSAANILDVLKKMTALQKSLTALAKKKTDIVKIGDMEALQSLLKEENKHIYAIQQMEKRLKNETDLFLRKRGKAVENAKLADATEAASENDKEALIKAKTALTAQIEELNHQNQLNQELLEQSLQFVQMSLDLLQPDIDSYNYDRTDKEQGPDLKPGRSLFDSKA